MTVVFTPNGSLNVAHDASDLPEDSDGNNVSSGAMVRCKNLRLVQKGIAKTRDGTFDLNTTAVESPIHHIEIQGGLRYTFAGTQIYEDEASIKTGLTSEPWTAIQYNAFNDTSPNIFALNGTDRKRIEGGAAYEWGIAAPTVRPVLAVGIGTGLTGEYNAKYTYVRKEGSVVIAESNPSPAASNSIVLAGQSLAVECAQPDDPQVTHIRLYRTQNGGSEYFFIDEIQASTFYSYGYTYDWEEEDGYIDGTGFKFTTPSTVNETDAVSGNVHITSVTSLSFTGSAGYKLGNDGIAYRKDPSGTYAAISGQWMLAGSAGNYECIATLVSGSTPSGELSEWLPLNSTREWLLSSVGESLLLVKIRAADTQNVLVAARIRIRRETAA